jgi:hypothetical protein
MRSFNDVNGNCANRRSRLTAAVAGHEKSKWASSSTGRSCIPKAAHRLQPHANQTTLWCLPSSTPKLWLLRRNRAMLSTNECGMRSPARKYECAQAARRSLEQGCQPPTRHAAYNIPASLGSSSAVMEAIGIRRQIDWRGEKRRESIRCCQYRLPQKNERGRPQRHYSAWSWPGPPIAYFSHPTSGLCRLDGVQACCSAACGTISESTTSGDTHNLILGSQRAAQAGRCRSPRLGRKQCVV